MADAVRHIEAAAAIPDHPGVFARVGSTLRKAWARNDDRRLVRKANPGKERHTLDGAKEVDPLQVNQGAIRFQLGQALFQKLLGQAERRIGDDHIELPAEVVGQVIAAHRDLRPVLL